MKFQNQKFKLFAFFFILTLFGCTDNNNLDLGSSSKLPEVTTKPVTKITDISATSGGEVISDGGQSVTERGVVWSSNPTPTVNDFKTSDGAGGGEFTSLLSNLAPNTSYFVRAYATNSVGTSYGLSLNFSTDLISVSTADVSSITETSAVCGGEVHNALVNTITKVGLVWSTHEAPTIDDFFLSLDNVSPTFTAALTGLESNTKYYVRAYGQSESKIYYGNEKSFLTIIDVKNEQLSKLSKTWKITSSTLDGTDQTGYDNLVLTISGTAGSASFGYSTAGRPSLSPWPSSGSWKFGDSPETQIIRDPGTGDELGITYSVTETELQVTFTFSGTGYPARTRNVKGQWVFTFSD